LSKAVQFPPFFGSTPKIGKSEVLEIDSINDVHLGGGVVCFRNAFNPNKELIMPWADRNAQLAHEQRWKYHTDSSGQKYAVNEDGNKFSIEQI
jgi:hypothetical protein